MLEYRIFYLGQDGKPRMTPPQVTEDTGNMLKNATEYVRQNWFRIEVCTLMKETWQGMHSERIALYERDPTTPPQTTYAPTWRYSLP